MEWFRVDSVPPKITKEMIGEDHLGDCPPTELGNECYVRDDGVNGVRITVEDPDPTGMSCNVGVDFCNYGLWWFTPEAECYDAGYTHYSAERCEVGSGSFSDSQDIIFREDSRHDLYINCWDKLGNKMIRDLETFYVDSTPPETTKTYGPEGTYKVEKDVIWIDTATLITLEATDAKIGVDKTYYRTVGPVSDDYCYGTCGHWDPNHPGAWTEYTVPFNGMEESCHIIEYYSDDLLGNVEPTKWQCMFVDKTAPEVTKTPGDPNVLCSEVGDKECDYYVRTNTPIQLHCEDVGDHPSNDVTIYWSYTVDGGDPVTGSHEGEDYDLFFPEDSVHVLDVWCIDAVGKESDHDIETLKVDTRAPTVEKIINEPYHGDCLPKPGSIEDECFVDLATTIELDIEDEGICAVDEVECKWRYRIAMKMCVMMPVPSCPGEKWVDNWTEWFTEFPISFPEESHHELEIVCSDRLGNTWEDTEYFYVDHTPPETTKTYSGLQYPGEGYPKWIGLETDIYLSATDSIGPHDSGIQATYYRVTQVADDYCAYEKGGLLCEDAEGDGEWQTYGQEPFRATKQSCHLIEYYSIDNVDKTEEVNKQCVYIDTTPPKPDKVVHEPRTPWDGLDSIFYEIDEFCEEPENCWKVTLLTPIDLECIDQDPHPVGNETVCFNVELDGDDATEDYCEEYDGSMEDDGYCCMERGFSEFYFLEETEHNLKYYCIDAVGNVGPIDDEKFNVKGTVIEIQLNKKWNLISVPFTLLNNDVEEVFSDVVENVESVWTYDGSTDQWFSYHPEAPPEANNLKEIFPGWGYWLAAYNDDTVVLGGDVSGQGGTSMPSRMFEPGTWNLIGLYGWGNVNPLELSEVVYDGPNLSDEGKPARCALYSLGEDDWDKEFSALLTYWEPDNPLQEKYLNQYNYMNPGAGYWLFTPVGGGYSLTTDCGPMPILT